MTKTTKGLTIVGIWALWLLLAGSFAGAQERNPLLIEGFEGIFLPADWGRYNLAGLNLWTETALHPHTGSFSARILRAAGAQNDWLVTPALDIPGFDYTLSFWEYVDFSAGYAAGNHTLWVLTGTWSAPPAGWIQVTEFAPLGEDTWSPRTINLDAYAGQTIWLAWRYQTSAGLKASWYIDDVAVTPDIDYQSHALLADDCLAGGAADGDGYLDPGETGAFSVTLVNTGSAAYTGIRATLSTATPNVTIPTDLSNFPDLAAGASGACLAPYQVYLDPTFPCGILVDFTLTITADGGATWTSTFTQRIGAPGVTPTTLLSENFDSTAVGSVPAGWAAVDVAGTDLNPQTASVTVHPAGYAAHSASNMFRWNCYDLATIADTNRLYCTTPLDLTTYTGAAVSLWMFQDNEYPVRNDFLRVQISTDGGATWANVGGTITRYSAAGDAWASFTRDLSAYDGHSSVMIGILCTSLYGNDVYLDELEVSASPRVCNICCTIDSCDFTATPDYGAAPLTVAFDSTVALTACTETPIYAWDFGDGAGTSTAEDPTYTYASGGAYTVTLTVSINDETGTSTGTVTVCELACGSSSASPTYGYAPLDVTFDSVVTVIGCTDPLAYAWDFDDGNTSTDADPTHTYAAGGTYDWTLTVTSGDETCQTTGSVTVCEITDCTAAADAGYGYAPLVVNFTGTVTTVGCDTETPVWFWDYGDGTNSTAQNPTHAYANGGTYDWTMTVTVGALTCIRTGSVTVCEITDCTAAAAPTYGPAPLTVNFIATVTTVGCATETPTWAWDFGDGGTSTAQNPTHAYANGGTYDWTMTVTVGALICTRTGSVTVCEIVCAAGASPAAGQTPLDVAFVSTVTATGCLDPVAYFWDFGDGATSTVPSPTHTFLAGGTYNWTLTVTSGAETCTETGSIDVCEIVCQASASPNTGLAPHAVAFTSTVTVVNCAGPVMYLWLFGDGGTSLEANPTHTYQGGDWEWELIVTVAGYECRDSGQVHVRHYNQHFLDDKGRSRLCVNTKSGAFEWRVFNGPGAGTYSGVCQIATQGGLVNYTTARGLPYEMRFRYQPSTGHADGVFTVSAIHLQSGLDDRNAADNPPGCD